MRILFVGDVVGKPGRRALGRHLLGLIDEHKADYVIVNIENSAGGFGVTASVFSELREYPIDCFTTGNHVWDKREVAQILESNPMLLRPANYPPGAPGGGVYVGETAGGVKVATINLEGRVFMKSLECPFRTADAILDELGDDINVVFVDFHAEATSEKQALGFHLDGRVSALVGTHTHVPTADERILPNGTAFQTDSGMTGPYESIIGMKVDKVLHRFLRQTPSPFEVAKRDVRLAGSLITVDETSGKASAIERIMVSDAES